MPDKIKPCPWCGVIPEVDDNHQVLVRFRTPGTLRFMVRCEWARCRVNPAVAGASLATVIRRWNTRKGESDAK